MAKPIKIVILGDAAGLSRTLNRSATELDTFAARAQRISRRIASAGMATAAVGKSITKGVTVPIVALAGAAGKMAVDFEAKMNLLHTAAGDSERNTKKISDGILGIAKSTGMSLQQLEEGAYVVDKSLSDMKGPARARKAIEMLRAASQGAVAEGTDLATMTDALSTVMKDYGDKLGTPVQATNALIAASGLSKTTMQTFVGSLSNVLPLAARLGIGFDEIGGAVATMSQHGVTAERATDNLNNSIRNLAAPNRVAQQEMQQLGINVVDLQKNLGQRGLKGTFDLITDAMEKHFGPAGLVALDTFRKSTSMAQGANKMLGAMPAAAKKVSIAYRDGTMSLNQWRLAVRDLTPQQASLAKQYATLQDKARGYNKELRSGDPQQQAAVEALKKMTGGATGLNTILMLTGDYEKSFAANTEEIGKKARASGKDIETWASTQKLAKTQLAQLKETLVTAAVRLGQGLIPAIKDAVQAAQPFIDTIARWAQKFHDADPKTQRMIIKIAAFTAILGPAAVAVGKLTVGISRLFGAGARIAGFAATAVLSMTRLVAGIARAQISVEGMQTRSYAAGLMIRRGFNNVGNAAASMGRGVSNTFGRLNSAIQSSSSAIVSRGLGGITRGVGAAARGVGSAMSTLVSGVRASARQFGAALSGFTLGATIGMMARNASKGVKALSVLGSAAAGAAAGFAMGGGLGAAVGGATGLLGGLIGVMGGASEAEQRYAQDTQNLTQAILDNNGAINANVRAVAAKALADAGALSYARTLGISLQVVEDAALGNTAAQEQLAAAMEKVKPSSHIQKGALAILGKTVDDLSNKTDGAIGKARLINDALGGTSAAAKGTATSLREAKSATDQLSGALQNLDGGALSAASANLSFQQAVASLTTKVKDNGKWVLANGTALDGNSAKARANRQAVIGALQAAEQHGQALQAQGKSAADVRAALDSDVQSLIRTATKAGFSEQAIRRLIAQMHLLPSQINTTINAATATASNRLGELLAQMRRLGQGVVIPVFTNPTLGTKHPGVAMRAAGGEVHGPGGPKGDKIPALLSDDEHVMTADEVHKAGGHAGVYRMRAMIRAGALRFANGGAVSTVKGANGHTYYRWNGHNYSSMDSVHDAQKSYAKKHQDSLRSSVSDPIGNVGNAPSSQIDVSSVGIARIRKQLAAASAALRDAIKLGLSAGAAASFRKQIKNLREEAGRQLGALRVKIKTSDMADIRKAMSGTADDLRQAFTQILTDSRAAGASTKRLQALKTLETSLLALQKGRATIVAKLAKDTEHLNDVQAKYNDVKSGVAGAATGAFNPLEAATTTTTGPALVANGTTPLTAQAGSTTKSGGVLGSLRAMVTKVKAFAGNLRKLVAKRVPLSIINQIANAGPIDGADAIKELLSYDGKQLDSLRQQSALLTKYSNQAGDVVAGANYGAQLKKAKSTVKDDKGWKGVVDSSIDRLVNPPKHKSQSGKSRAHGAGTYVAHQTVTNHIKVNNPRATAQQIAREVGFMLKTSGR